MMFKATSAAGAQSLGTAAALTQGRSSSGCHGPSADVSLSQRGRGGATAPAPPRGCGRHQSGYTVALALITFPRSSKRARSCSSSASLNASSPVSRASFTAASSSSCRMDMSGRLAKTRALLLARGKHQFVGLLDVLWCDLVLELELGVRGRQTDEALEGARRHGELVLLLLAPGLARCSWGLVHEARLEAHAHVSVPIRQSDPRLLAEHRLLALAHAEVFPQEVDGDHFRHVVTLAVLLLEDLGRFVLPTR